jgi:hypothetical protein
VSCIATLCMPVPALRPWDLLGPVPGCELCRAVHAVPRGALAGAWVSTTRGRLLAVLAYRDAFLLSDKALNRRSAKGQGRPVFAHLPAECDVGADVS